MTAIAEDGEKQDVRTSRFLPPFQQPAIIREAEKVCSPLHWKLWREVYIKKLEALPMTNEKPQGINWVSVGGNVIATVLGAGVIALSGAIFWTAYQVPRQQDAILRNQELTREAINALGDRVDRIETNDRLQDNKLYQLPALRAGR